MAIRRIDPNENISLDQNQVVSPDIVNQQSTPSEPKIRKLDPNERIMLDQERVQVPAYAADPLYYPQKPEDNSLSGLLKFGATDATRRAYEYSGNITTQVADVVDKVDYQAKKFFYDLIGQPESTPQIDTIQAPQKNWVSRKLTESADQDFANANILAGKVNEINAQPTVDWEQVKQDPVSMNTLRFMAEQGTISSPEMLMAMVPILGLPIIGSTTAQSIIEGRQRNLGKDPRSVSGEDFLFSSGIGLASGGLERLGGLASAGLIGDAGRVTMSQIPRNALESGLEEAATEAIQNPLELVGSTVGTGQELTAEDLLDSAAQGALVGFGTGTVVRSGTDSVRALKNGITQQPMDNGGVTPNENALNPDIPLLPPPTPASPPVPNRDDLARMISAKPDATTEESLAVQPETVKPPISGIPEIGDTIEHVDQYGQVIEGTINSIQEGENGQKTLIVTDAQGNQNIVFDGEGETIIRDKRPLNRDDLLSEIQRGHPKQDVAPQAETQPLIEPDIAPQDTPIAIQGQPKTDTIESIQASIDNIRAQAKISGWNGMLKRREQEALNQLSALKQTEINKSALEANPEPTDAQKQAGNYKKGHVKVSGFDIAIENAKGSVRKGIDSDGEAWETTMPANYGYIKRTEGADGDNVDVYIGDNPDAQEVFIVDQIDPVTGKFDEHKVMMGFNSSKEAGDAYKNAFSDGKGVSRIGAVEGMSIEKFKEWLKTSDTKKPIVYQEPSPQPAETQEVKPKSVEPKPNTSLPIKGEVGMMLSSGQVATTASGRTTTPFPKFSTETPRKTSLAVKNVENWLMQNALAEANARGDEFNAIQFQANMKKPSQSDKDSAEYYLFGETQPQVQKSIFREQNPVVSSKSETTTDAPVVAQNAPTEQKTEDKPVLPVVPSEPEVTPPVQELRQNQEAKYDTKPPYQYVAYKFVEPTLSIKSFADFNSFQDFLDKNNDWKKLRNRSYPQETGDYIYNVKAPNRFEKIKSTQNEEIAPTIETTENQPSELKNVPETPVLGQEPQEQVKTISDEDIEMAIRNAKPWKYLDDLKIDVRKQLGLPENYDFGMRVYSINKSLGPKLIKEAGWLEATPDLLQQYENQKVYVLRGVGGISGERTETATIKATGKGGYLALPPGARTKGYYPNYIKPIEIKTTTEPQESAPETAAVETPADKPKDTIEDFGEKISGAKKDLWKDYERSIGDELPAELKDITLSKHFPEPNYEVMIANGVTTDVLAAIKAMRDIIPSKPQKSWKLKEWASKVKTVRDLSKMMLDGKFTAAEIKERMSEYSKVLRGLVERMELYSDLGYPAFTDAKDWEVQRSEGAYENGKPIGRTQYFASYKKSYGNRFETRQEAVDYIRGKINSAADKTNKKSVSFEVYRITKTGEVVIGKKIAAGKFINLKGGFKTGNEARLYMAENGDELVALYEKKKEVPPERRSTNDPRKGEDYRKGEDVSVETLAKTFGFRGIQFGNYVEQKRRAADINNAYDAMKDMATILGLPENALSLEGTLGLAFGARGGGSKAAAHYEPSQQVINLTKSAGAGSLAHEWFHAFDHNFGKRREGRDVFLMDSAYLPTKEIRKEVTDGFNDVMKAILQTGVKTRSQRIDANRTKDYWSTAIEMAARSFEAYIIHKAEQKGGSNDYLANIVGKDAWEMLRGENEDDSTYPYPTEKEMSEKIAPAFDKLFQVLETKDTDKGAVMFSLTAGQKPTVTNTQSFKDWFGDSKVVDDKGEPLVMYHGTPNGVFESFDTYASKYGLMGQGGYFTDNPAVASEYTEKGVKRIERDGETPEKVVYPVYLSIKNPIDMDAKADFSKWADAYSDYLSVDELEDSLSDGATNESVFRELEEILSQDQIPDYEGAEIVQDGLRSMGYDGITHIGGGRVDKDGVRHRVYIAFDPEQIKSTFNRGTFDPKDPRISFSRKESGEDTAFLRETGAKPQNKAAMDKIIAALNKQAKKLGLPENSAVIFENLSDIKNVPNLDKASQDGGVIDGFYYKNLIYIAMTAKDYISTLNHEAVHYLKAAGAFTQAEWDTLLEKAPKWREKYNIQKNYGDLNLTESKLDEEAIAHALQDYSTQGILTRIRNKIIKYFNMVKNVVTGKGYDYKTPEALFDDIMSGEIGRRRFDPEYDVEPMFSRGKTQTDSFKKWFGDSKIVDEDGNPMVVYHGSPLSFDKFKEGSGIYGSGIYFSKDKKTAQSYSDNGVIYETYLSIQKPFIIDDLDSLESEYENDGEVDTTALIENLKSSGFDGIIINDKNSETYAVAFDPEQIKSVNNRGTFDANDERIMLSRKVIADDGLPLFSILGKKNGKKRNKEEQLQDAIESLDARGLADKLRPAIGKIASYVLHPHQIASLYKSFTPVYLGAIDMMKTRDVLVHKLSDNITLYNKMNKQSKARIDGVLELGRLSKQNYKINADGKIVVKNEGYKDTLHSKDGDTITLSDVEAKAYQGVRDAMDLALDTYSRTILEEYGFVKMGLNNKQDLIKALSKEKNKSVIKQMQDVLRILQDIEDAKRKGYIPLKRWGEIGITVRTKGEDAELVHFERIELPNNKVPFIGKKNIVGENKAVIEAVKRLREKYPADTFAIDSFEVKDFTSLQAKIDLNELDVLAASSDMSEADYDTLREMIADAMKRRGFRQHFFQSNDVSGYSGDFERAINDYVVSISGHLSRRMHIPKLDAAIKQIIDTGEASIADYATKYVKYVTDPVEEFGAVRQMAYMWYLAGNVASGVTNASQPFMVTAPWFKAMFSHGQIAKQMGRAYKDATAMLSLKKGTDVFDFSKAPDDVREALKRANAEGYFIPLQTYDAMAIANSNSSYMRGTGRRVRDVMDVLSLTFSVPERTNRVVTYVSAYRFAIQPENKKIIMAFINRDQLGRASLIGKEGAEFAEAFADYAVMSTQLRMGKLNRPTLSRGVGTLPFQFMSFSLQMFELMYRLKSVHGGKGAMSVGMMMFAVVAMAGIKGIPFEDDLQKLFEATYKKLTRTDIDIDSEMLKLLTNSVGKTAAQAIVKGIPYALANVDMSGRLGYGNIVPDGQSDLLGVWFDMLYTKPTQAATDLARGDELQATANVLPAFIRNPIQAYLWATGGVKSGSTGDTIIPPEDLTKTDIGLKMLGFTSSAISGERNRIYAEKRASTAANELRSDYYDRLARAYAGRIRASRNGDKEAELRYGDEIEAINIEKNTHNEDAPLHKQIIINDRTLKQRVVEEINGAKANKPRKQARQEAEELKKVWGN